MTGRPAALRLRQAAMVAALAVFAAVSIEAGVRARLFFNDPHRWDADGLFRYRANTQVGDTPGLTTNKDGFFGPGLALPKPPGTLRAVLLGSSPLTNPELPAALAEELQDRIPGARCEVNSAGLPRYTSWHNARLYARHIAPLEPDWAVVYLGLNDNVYNTNPGLSGRPPAGLWNWADTSGSVVLSMLRYHGIDKRFGVVRDFTVTPSVAEFESNLRDILDTARAAGTRVLLVKMAVAAAPEDAALASAVAGAEGPMSHFWGTRDAAMRGLVAHNTVLERLAAEFGVPLADAAPVIPETSEYLRDLCHFTPAGNRLLAAFLADTIARLHEESSPPQHEPDLPSAGQVEGAD